MRGLIYYIVYLLLLNLVIYNLITCCNVNKGNTYLDKIYTKVNKVKNAKNNWFKK
jgi:hypothetical protein